MNQILLVAIREFLSQVKNKTFIITTVLGPLIMIAIIGIIAWMMSANTGKKALAVIDNSGEFITTLASGESEIYSFYEAKDLQGIKDTLSDSKTLDGLLMIPKIDTANFESLEKGIELTTVGNLGVSFKEKLETKLSKRIETLKMEKTGITEEQLKNIKSNVSIKTFDISGEDKGDKDDYLKFGIALILCYIIFTFIMLYGVKVMRSVVEEKHNRVVEIIISSVKPFNLMMGKILGTTFVAFTQFFVWIIMGGILFTGVSAFLSSKLDMSNIQMAQAQELMSENPEWMSETQDVLNLVIGLDFGYILFFFLIYFVLGYVFYSSVFAAIGSAVDKEADTQQFTFYPMFPMIIALYGSMTALDNPDGPVSFWLSMIPFTSPISMTTRLPFGVPAWELALSLALLIGTTLFMVFFAAKIYRVGILMYGKKPSFKEMLKWMRQG